MPHRFAVWCCSLAFLLLPRILVAAQPAVSEATAPRLDPEKQLGLHVLDRWTIEDGLPSNTIFDIAQDEDGYLWLATDSGLARFDGIRFTTFDTTNTPALGNNLVRDLHFLVDGSLWIASGGGGLTHYSRDSFESLTAADGLPSDNVAAITGDRSGTLWIGFEDGRFSRLRNGVVTHIGFAADEAPVAIQELDTAADGSIWIMDGSLPFATGNPRVLRYRNGNIEALSIPIAPPGTRLLSAILDDKGVLWASTLDAGNPTLYRFVQGAWEAKNLPAPPTSSATRTMYIDRSGALWLGAGAVYRVTDDRVDMLTTLEGLPDPRIRSFFEDREGNFWIGTYGGGLLRIKNGRDTHYPPYDSILALYQSRVGTLWGGTTDGLMRFEHGEFQLVAAADSRQMGQVRSIAEGPSGALWIATDIGLVRYADGAMHHFTTQQGLPAGDIHLVYADREGRLWLGLTDPANLVTFEDGLFSQVEYFENKNIRAIHQDRSGTMWFGQSDGRIHHLQGGRYTQLEQDGMPIRAFHEDDRGHLWVATWGAGLLRLKDGVVSSYTKKDGLFSDTAAWILEDDEGVLWVSTDQGIYGVSKQAIEDYDSGSLDKIPVTVHGKDEGLKSLECDSRGFPSGWKTTDGRLWFTMFQGAAVVGPKRLLNPLPPPVLVEEILAGAQPATGDELAAISPDRRDLEIHYSAPSLRSPENVRFQYQLVGYDDDWVDAGNRRVAYYTHVPPGTYQFRVKAANESGVWNEAGAARSITVLPYFHETLWFRSLAVLLLGALTYAAHRARAARAEKRAEELESLVQAKEEKEQELRKSEARFRAFMDHTPAIMYMKDETGRHLYFNRTLEKYFGVAPEQLIGTTSRDVFPADLSEQMEAADQYVLEHKKDMELPEYSESTRGRKRWWKDIKFPVPLSEQKTLLGGIAVDLTSQKEAELELQRIKDRIERENLYLRDEIQKSLSEFDEIVGQSNGLKEVLLKVQQVASTETTVLLTGETGTGKELIARAIHRRSPRNRRSLITVNCAALPPTLIESELFGHEKGAFTGATERRIGRFELADRATIFLDEIGDVDMSLQTKLLRVLQDGELERVGSTRTRKVDVRVIAATNQNLQQAIGEGRFREDLFYRLNVFPIEIPPLRERREDIPLLVWYFVGKKAGELRKTIDKIPALLMEALQSYEWPGNIRELQNVLERAVITSTGNTLWIDTTIGQQTSSLEQHLASESDLPYAPVPPEGRGTVTASGQSLADLERSHIVSVLTDCEWRISGPGNAANRLGLNPSTLRHRMKKLGIEVPRRQKEATPSTAQTLRDKEREHILTVLDETGWKITGRGNAAERLGLKPSTLRFRMKKLGIERS